MATLGLHAPALVTLAASIGCVQEGLVLVPELPAEPGFVGIVYRGPGGAWSGTGLRRTTGGRSALDVVEPGPGYDQLSVVYFSDAALRAHTSLPESELERAPLLAPGPEQLALTPSFSASGPRGVGLSTLRADAPPRRVSAAWAGACPEVLPADPVPVEVRCAFRPCLMTARQEGCELVFEGDTCGYRARATVSGLGELRVDLGGFIGRCEGRGETDGRLAALGCSTLDTDPVGGGRCELRLHAAPDVVPALEVTSRIFADGPYASTPRAEQWITAMLVEPERILLARVPGITRQNRRLCDGDLALELVHLDPIELEPRATYPAPACLIELTPSASTGVYLALLTGPEPGVAQISETGEVLRRVDLPRIFQERLALAWSLQYDAATDVAVVLARLFRDEGDNHAVLFFFDGSTLAERHPSLYLSEHAVVVPIWLHAPGVLRLIRQKTRLVEVGLDTGVARERANLASICSDHVPHAVLPLPEEDLAISSHGAEQALFVTTSGLASCDRAVSFEKDRAPSAAVVWPGDPGRLLVGMLRRQFSDPSGGFYESTLAFYDRAAGRFLRPSFELGAGHIDALVARPDGSVVGVAMREGRVFRVRAR